MERVDSTMFGYYYKQVNPPSDTTTFPKDTTFYINYTGRLLDGKVFDTSIEDTAKVYGLYSAKKTYAPKYVNMKENYKDITMGASSSETGSTLVDGFSYCLSKMRTGEKGICIFYSDLGYKGSGSGMIPAFSPLRFDIEMIGTKLE